MLMSSTEMRSASIASSTQLPRLDEEDDDGEQVGEDLVGVAAATVASEARDRFADLQRGT